MLAIPKNPRRLFTLLGLLLAVFVGDRIYRHWRPNLAINTPHYSIFSNADAEQTAKISNVVEVLYSAYTQVFTNPPTGLTARLKLKLYKDQAEFKRVNRGMGWAEAFYREPFCHAYYSAAEINPYHWMLHEATHQLNREISHFRLPKWADEGTATYFSTSVISHGVLKLGQIDGNAYPIWWLDDLKLSGDIQKDIASNQIIPLRAIVTGSGGPGMNQNFNLYYVHWWSLSHFLFQFDGGKYRQPYLQVLREGASLDVFEKHIGPIEAVQAEWYRYLQPKAGPK
jgi:hypothetical protein